MADSSDENKQDNNGKSSHYSIVPDDSSESDSTEVGSDQHRGERELDWNATYARNVEELLLSKLRAVFEGAIKQIVELGYSEDVAKMALSRKALYIQEGDPVSNIVNATLNVLKGKYVTTSDISFGNIQHLVFYTLSEMIADLRKARPSLTAGEALWSLLMCDLNFSLACTSEEFENVDSNGESFTSPSIPQNSPNNERVKSEEENDSLPSVSGRPFETSGDVCKGGSSSERHNVKEIKSLTQMFHHMKKAYRACEKGSLMIDKKIEPPSDIHNQQMKSFSSNTKSKQGVCASDATCYLSTNTASTLPAGGSSATLPDAVFPSSIVNPNISASDTISKPKSQRNPFDAQKIPDYCAGIPYDESMGKYVPRDQNDEAILELVRRAHLLQGKLQRWINWANRKITHVTVRAVKLQPELKMLKKEKQEAEKDAILFQENAVKKISEMDNATENTKKQIDSTTTDALLLEAEYTMLHEELVAERLSLEKSMTRHQQAIEREQRALTRAEFLESENALHRDDLERDKQKLSKLQQQLDKEKILLTRVEGRMEKERSNKEKLLAQAASIRREKKRLAEHTKAEEDKIIKKAAHNLQKCVDVIAKLETQLEEIKRKSESETIAALHKGEMSGSKKPSPSKTIVSGQTKPAAGSFRREHECVMCLSEEMSVVFLPCAHQVLCAGCNRIHDRQGVKDCPSCRTRIEHRLHVRFADK